MEGSKNINLIFSFFSPQGAPEGSANESVFLPPDEKNSKTISWAGVWLPYDGYGNANINSANAMVRMGCDIEIVNMPAYINSEWRHQLPVTLRSLVDKSVPHERARNERRVVFFPPNSYSYLHGQKTMAITMFETTKIPDVWVPGINQWTDRMVVPSRWNKEVFENCGVMVPIDVVPLAVDFAKYPRMERWDSKYFVFLMYGNLSKRKGVDIAYNAFRKAFSKKDDVRLVLKTIRHTLRCDKSARGDDQVVFIDEEYDQEQMRELMAQADVVLSPSRGEGFGMCPVESMATGAAVILTDGTALSEMCDDRFNIGIPYKKWVKADYEFCWLKEDVGEWVEPDADYLADAMRWCYENPDKAKAMGRSAASWVRTQYGAVKHGKRLAESMEATWG